MPCHLTGFFLFEAYGRKGHEMEVKVKVLEVSFEIPEEYVERIMDALTSIGLEKEYEDWDEDCEKDVDWEAVWYGIDENYPETVIKCRPLTNYHCGRGIKLRTRLSPRAPALERRRYTSTSFSVPWSVRSRCCTYCQRLP